MPGVGRRLSVINYMKHIIKVIAAAGLFAAFASVLQAQPYYIVGDVINGWANPGAIQMSGGPTVYSYVVTGGTAGNYEQLKVTDGTWNTAWPGNNLEVKLDATGGNTIYFYPGTIIDGWLPVQNRVGYADPGNMAFEITGDFTSPTWGSDPNAQLVSAGNGVYTNTYTIATPGTYGFKFRTPNTWNEVNFGVDFGNGSGNASITTTNANQRVLFQLDLPNGRWLAGNLAPPPVTNQVVFAVDMTRQIELGFFTPGSAVYVAGAFNSWPNPGTTGLLLNNDPPYNGGDNTNIYYGTNSFVGSPGSAITQYKFNNNDPAAPNVGWETSNNRTVTLLSSNGTEELPVVYFSDAYVSDYAAQNVAVTFVVNMTNATTYPDGHVFDPQNDQVYINGSFLPGGWAPWNPLSLNQMQNDPPGSEIYTYTAYLPARSANSLIKIDYKYGIGYATVTNYDNEAAAYNDHFRYVRSTVNGAYTNAMDTFGNQYSEPSFGQLASASAAPGMVSVSWLGRPGVQVQETTNMTDGSWQSIAGTDGTNWANGYSSTNGFVSQTNWPAADGQHFFRLIQAW